MSRRSRFKKMWDLTGRVEELLYTKPALRDSDVELYIALINSIKPNASSLPLEDILRHDLDYGLPCMASVSRVRRRLQEHDPTLRATDAVIDGRYENYKAVKEWAVNG